MGIIERFFGKEHGADGFKLSANEKIKNPLSLQLLFQNSLQLDNSKLTDTLRSYHRTTKDALFEIDPQCAAQGTPFGLAGWGKHVIRVVGFNVPMPAKPLEKCIQPAHYNKNLKDLARKHESHVILFYAGYEEAPLEQYAALAVVAAVLSAFGAFLVLNESAHTSFPADAFKTENADGDSLDFLREFPIPFLYTGFVKMEVDGTKGIWMRTFGNQLLGDFPNFATLASGHDQGEKMFMLFNQVLEYLMSSKAKLGAGHTMQCAKDLFMKFRRPKKEEYFLETDGEMLVIEFISESEINRTK